MPVKLHMDENDLKELSNHDRIFLEVVRTHGEYIKHLLPKDQKIFLLEYNIWLAEQGIIEFGDKYGCF